MSGSGREGENFNGKSRGRVGVYKNVLEYAQIARSGPKSMILTIEGSSNGYNTNNNRLIIHRLYYYIIQLVKDKVNINYKQIHNTSSTHTY